jgi:hypothetical protein
MRETLLKDEDGEMIVGQDDAEGGLYDNEEGDDEYGKTLKEPTKTGMMMAGDDCDYGEDAGDPTFPGDAETRARRDLEGKSIRRRS